MTVLVPLLTKDQIEALPERAREVVEYRKSGLSLNHVQGCPLDCAYCIRHTYGVWDMRQPRALTDDASAVRALVEHPYFQADVTPIQIFNRATEPMLPQVKHHLFAVLADLDARGLRNHVLVITRYRMTAQDCQRLNDLTNVKLTLLFTYSGIDDKRIEPYPSPVAANSLRLASALSARYRTVLYWRPLVPGLNDTARHMRDAVELSKVAHATVFTGLFYRGEIAAYYRANGLPEPYERHGTTQDRARDTGTAGTGRRSPTATVGRCSARRAARCPTPTACPTTTATTASASCATSARWHNWSGARRRMPSRTRRAVRRVAARVPGTPDFEVVDISDRAVVVHGLDEQPRYHLQHALAFQIHDARHPHRPRRHGRAEIGWETAGTK